MTNSEIKLEAKELVKGNRGSFILAWLIVVAFTSLSAFNYTRYFGSVAELILGGPIFLGLATIALTVAEGGTAKVEDVFSGFKNFTTAFVAYLLQAIYLCLWCLLIVPIFIKPFSYAMTYYILKDNPDISANEAITRSRIMMDGNKWKLFCLYISFIGWYLLSILTFGILLFWLIPYVKTAEARFYLDLRGDLEPEAEAEENNRCPVCGYKNEKDSKYCEKCGEELIKTAEIEEGKDIVCPICGTENDADSKYCSRCGEELKK